MSRSSRRGKSVIGKQEGIPWARPDLEARRQYFIRVGKRAMIQGGLILDPKTRPEKWSYTWEYGDQMGTVYADNKGEARALIKKALGTNKNKRLPKEVRIVRAPNIEHTKAAEQSYENLRALSDKNKASGVVG